MRVEHFEQLFLENAKQWQTRYAAKKGAIASLGAANNLNSGGSMPKPISATR
jgi:hypothetical protein